MRHRHDYVIDILFLLMVAAIAALLVAVTKQGLDPNRPNPTPTTTEVHP